MRPIHSFAAVVFAPLTDIPGQVSEIQREYSPPKLQTPHLKPPKFTQVANIQKKVGHPFAFYAAFGNNELRKPAPGTSSTLNPKPQNPEFEATVPDTE